MLMNTLSLNTEMLLPVTVVLERPFITAGRDKPCYEMVAISIQATESNVHLFPNKEINSAVGEVRSYPKLLYISWVFRQNTDLMHPRIVFFLMSPDKGEVVLLIAACPLLLWTPFFRKSFLLLGRNVYKLLVKRIFRCLPLPYFSSMCMLR